MESISQDKNKLLALLKEFSFRKGEVVLASGKKSSFYIDCKQVAFRGDALILFGNLFFEMMSEIERIRGLRFDACAGVELGAVPLACALSMVAQINGRFLPAIGVRKESKGHGTGAFLEGLSATQKGARVLLVEDVLTTGGSAIKAAWRLREHGFEQNAALVIIDRQEGGLEAMKEAGVDAHALFAKQDFLAVG